MPKTAWSRWRSLTRHVLTKLTITSAPSHGLPALERTAERPPHFVLASKSRDKNGVLGMGAVPSLTLACVIKQYTCIGQEAHMCPATARTMSGKDRVGLSPLLWAGWITGSPPGDARRWISLAKSGAGLGSHDHFGTPGPFAVSFDQLVIGIT